MPADIGERGEWIPRALDDVEDRVR